MVEPNLILNTLRRWGGREGSDLEMMHQLQSQIRGYPKALIVNHFTGVERGRCSGRV
jgi:hypothetical protein